MVLPQWRIHWLVFRKVMVSTRPQALGISGRGCRRCTPELQILIRQECH